MQVHQESVSQMEALVANFVQVFAGVVHPQPDGPVLVEPHAARPHDRDADVADDHQPFQDDRFRLLCRGALAGPLPYESGWREVAPPAGGGFDAVQAAVKCGASACTELVVNGARNNAVFSLTLALSQGASTQAELVALAAGLLSRVGADLEPAPGEPQVPALPDAPTPEAAAAPVHDSFPTDWVLTLADAQAFAPGLSGFQVTGEARWTADAGWSGGGAVPAALNTAAARDPGILFATGPDEIGYVPVPSLGGAEISAQRASFHMIWDGAGGGPAMYLRLFMVVSQDVV